MLIIFDLDDTLIDTSGCITPIKLEDALHRMKGEGLHLPSVPDALEMIRRLDEASDSARHTLSEFLEINNLDRRFLEIGVKEIYENISPDIPIFPFDRVVETLSELASVHQLALVTVGFLDQQLNKLKKAGIDSMLFSKIVVCRDSNKKPHYQAIVEHLNSTPSEILVCGDRISVDLSPARELGFKTVHMKKGRGLNHSGPKSDVDYSISQLAEIKEIIASLVNFAS